MLLGRLDACSTSVKRAIVSDIHGNLEALEAVLADIAAQGVDSIYCLGDIVGYGPNPRECIDRVMSFELSILGNHDQGALYDPEGFSSGAERAIFWTRDQLEMANGDAGTSGQAVGVPQRAAADASRGAVHVRAWLGPQSAQRVRLSRGHAQLPKSWNGCSP